ncbi:MAG: GTP 3',8-cyclase MoaA [Candidatus Hydrogenedentes bacterium]|nr:GTP 3',8-cyclase MoaA [Candidatus Hydrogenedentota bacterium]
MGFDHTHSTPATCAVSDKLGRPLHDLRISVTDRCNLRCTYCMPEEHFGDKYPFLQRRDLLSFEEIVTVARAVASMGGVKLRLTGGEPLLRKNLSVLVAMLHDIPGIDDIALTTNGILLPQFAQELRDAGVRRVTISLDSLNEATFAKISGRPIKPTSVLEGIDAARAAGFGAVKVNAVIQKGVNDEDIVPLAAQFRGTGVVMRFIEFMDVGTLNGWNRKNVVTGAEMVARISERYPLEPIAPNYHGEVATRYRYTDGQGEVGFIQSVSQPFCGNCSRLRLAPNGELYTCLFGNQSHPLKPLFEDGADEDAVRDHIHSIWSGRKDRYSEIRTEHSASANRVEMYHIGG